MAKPSAEVRIAKIGPNGRPHAEVLVDPKIAVADLGSIIQKVTSNKDLLKKVGLKACPACKSGLDILIRDKFTDVITISG